MAHYADGGTPKGADDQCLTVFLIPSRAERAVRRKRQALTGYGRRGWLWGVGGREEGASSPEPVRARASQGRGVGAERDRLRGASSGPGGARAPKQGGGEWNDTGTSPSRAAAVGAALAQKRSAAGSGSSSAWDWLPRGPGALGPRAASSPLLRQEGRWLGPPKSSGGRSWKGATSRAQSTPRPRRHRLRRLPKSAASTVPAAQQAIAAVIPLGTMPWRRLSALFRHRWSRSSPPGTGSGRRLEYSEFVEYTEPTEPRRGPVEPVNAMETVFALAVIFSSHLIPCGWVLTHLESYRRV
ncbi:uncharacterized protein LOC100927040 [Sarcophilus harrisii]|uniref:uncharacterized protein LOC100927040 n=1 Tax=Sarcophilus harrisii TaxID=9305 RepID=UPI001301EA6E|nr:uncharacterized protein LOC100927040 [Sarcophilus harrisii]